MSKPIEMDLAGQKYVAIPVHEYNKLTAQKKLKKANKFDNIKIEVFKGIYV